MCAMAFSAAAAVPHTGLHRKDSQSPEVLASSGLARNKRYTHTLVRSISHDQQWPACRSVVLMGFTLGACRAGWRRRTFNAKRVKATQRQATAQEFTSALDRALQVNLMPDFYGTFAEIGAGQEVSRTFLRAGAAAGTVAKAVSAYDKLVSDHLYGTAKRYVTKERLLQMIRQEFEEMEATLRESRGPETRFFSFAATVAAKAFNSDRECEGWLGVTYQHEAKAEPSTIVLHVRMTDPTAALQGDALGILGTNLIYLCTQTLSAYNMAQRMMENIADDRLSITLMEFTGPIFEGDRQIDSRLVALRLVQSGNSEAILMLPNEDGSYQMATPNEGFYKRQIILERGRFSPVTMTHKEVIESAARKLAATDEADKKGVMQLMSLNTASSQGEERGRSVRQKLVDMLDMQPLGFTTQEELLSRSYELTDEMVKDIFNSLDIDENAKLSFSEVEMAADPSCAEFLNSFDMLAAIRKPILISNISRNSALAAYLARYNVGRSIVVAVGGGDYYVERGLFGKKEHESMPGGMLASFGELFTGRTQVYTFPNISASGSVSPTSEATVSNPEVQTLLAHLLQTKKVVGIETEFINPEVLDSDRNAPYRGGSNEVKDMIRKNRESPWDVYVPAAVAQIIKERGLYDDVQEGIWEKRRIALERLVQAMEKKRQDDMFKESSLV